MTMFFHNLDFEIAFFSFVFFLNILCYGKSWKEKKDEEEANMVAEKLLLLKVLHKKHIVNYLLETKHV